MNRQQGYLALVLGLALAAYGGFTLKLARASLAWPTVDGVVVDPGGRRPLTYRYRVDGITYLGSVIGFSMGASKERYPDGARVSVHYDPGDPARAALEPGGGAFSAGYVVVGLLISGLVGLKLLRS